MRHQTMNDYGAKLLIVAEIRYNCIEYKKALQWIMRDNISYNTAKAAESHKKMCELFFESEWAEWLCEVVDMTPKHIMNEIRRETGFDRYEQQGEGQERGAGALEGTPEVRIRDKKRSAILWS